MARILKILLFILVIVALIYWFYQRGGEQPIDEVEQPVSIPATSGPAQ